MTVEQTNKEEATDDENRVLTKLSLSISTHVRNEKVTLIMDREEIQEK